MVKKRNCTCTNKTIKNIRLVDGVSNPTTFLNPITARMFNSYLCVHVNYLKRKQEKYKFLHTSCER